MKGKKLLVDSLLSKLLREIGMDRPSNYIDILDFVYNDIDECADPENWHSGDVVIAFRRFLETKTQS